MTTTPVLLSRRNTPVPPAIPDLDRLNARFESAHPVEVIRWAVAMFGDSLCLTTSFQDTLLVDLAVSVDPEIEVVFLDTGFHFAETLDVLRRAQSRYSLHLRVERPEPDAADVWANGQEACCAARKVDPLDRALAGKVAWLSGLRRDDGGDRASSRIVEVDRQTPSVKRKGAKPRWIVCSVETNPAAEKRSRIRAREQWWTFPSTDSTQTS